MSKDSQLIDHLPRLIAEQALPLEEAGIEYAKGEVEMILCYLLKIDRLRLYLDGKRLITAGHLELLQTIIEKRSTRYPLQYILEESWFYGRRFFVSEAVMVPTPETEVLIEAAKRFVNRQGYDCCRMLDIGVGSGVISVTMAAELKNCAVTAVDISNDAIEVARRNAVDQGVSDKIEFRQSDILGSIKPDEKFDLILSNPPYISDDEYKVLPPEVLADPKVSLTSGDEGLDAIKEIIKSAPDHLAEGGRLMFEIGYNQADRVAQLTEGDPRYQSIVIMKDLNDIDRVVILACD